MGSSDIPRIPTEITVEPFDSTSGTLVRGRFERTEDFATQAWNTAIDYLNSMSDQDYTIPWTELEVEDVDSGLDVVAVRPGALVITSTDITLPTFTKNAPEMDEVTISIPDVPNFTSVAPELSIPDVPDVNWPIFTKEAPTTGDIDIPTVPSIDLPAVPTVDDITVIAPPDFQMPSFEGTLPTADLTPPEPMFTWNEAEYSTDLLDALEEKIRTDVINGGTGLDAETEAAIYNRARSRMNSDNQEQIDRVLNYFASRGHSQPPGALSADLLEIRNKILQVLEDLENDILIQQSKLAQENTHFVVTSGIAYEKSLMDYSNQVNQRAFEAAKYVVEYGVIIYQVRVTAYQAELEAYKTFAQVFEAKIRAEIAKVEFYRARVEGQRLSVEVQALVIEAYKAQVDSLRTLIDLYVAQMQGASIQSQIDRNRIEAYGVEVQAFAAKNNALVARFNAYQAQIAGETEKAKMFMAEAQAYESQVRGYKAKADVEISRVQIEVEELKGKVASFVAEIDKYKAEVQAALTEAQIIATEQGFRTDAYKAETTQYVGEVDALVRIYLGKIEELKAKLDQNVKEADIQIQGLLGQYELALKNLDSGTRVSAQLAASAMGAVSASAHVNFGEQRSDARGWQAGWTANTGVTAQFYHDVTKQNLTQHWGETHSYTEPNKKTAPSVSSRY